MCVYQQVFGNEEYFQAQSPGCTESSPHLPVSCFLGYTAWCIRLALTRPVMHVDMSLVLLCSARNNTAAYITKAPTHRMVL